MSTAAKARLAAVASHLWCPRGSSAATPGAGEAPTNSPRGPELQGFGIGWDDRPRALQPPVFDPVSQFQEACAFYAETGFVIVDALRPDEVSKAQGVFGKFLADADGEQLKGGSLGQGQLLYPLLGNGDDLDRYAGIDFAIDHPRVLPIIADSLGGLDHVRFQEFNMRGYPAGFGAKQPDGSYRPGSRGMAFHSDATADDHFTRQPYGPPDYCSAFYYLTDVTSHTPAFCVVPHSKRAHSLSEVKDQLGEAYCEYRVEGKAGLCIIADSATMHTRLDGDGHASRRIMHLAYARGGWIQLDDGGWRPPAPALFQLLIPQRLAFHADPGMRRLCSLWSPSMCEWAAGGFQTEYITDPTRRAPKPGH